MHTPLDAHLHTEECNKIIENLMKCYAENNKFKQCFGACDDLYMSMRKCTKAERIARETEAKRKTLLEVEERAKKLAKIRASGITWQEHLRDRLREKAQARRAEEEK